MCGETPVRYVYDGSFEGLLCCVYESVYSHMLPQEVVCEADAQPSLFGEVAVRTQPEKAARVFASIARKIGPAAEELVRDTYFSCAPGRDPPCDYLYHYTTPTPNSGNGNPPG